MPITLPQGSEPGSEPTSEKDKKTNRVRQEYPLNFAETAAFLRELADTLETGSKMEMEISQQQILLAPDEPITLEITYREDPKKKKMEIELEIKEHFGSAGRGAGRPTLKPVE
ncbi:MAG TPA: amphi-Trp domain-containing protein [Methanothrix sp.]|nr:amphi-Trp domain-containing protein [Methanothrix sp.]HPJ84520.1 amphi-Trp domain-containing protein [Methanothrix sp.]